MLDFPLLPFVTMGVYGYVVKCYPWKLRMRRHGEVANEVCRVAPEVGEDDKVWFDPKPKILPTNLDHGKTSGYVEA